MVLLYLSIPFMLLGLSIALAPLVWAMRQDQHARVGAISTSIGPPADPEARRESRAA
jgi:hypothetical protein